MDKEWGYCLSTGQRHKDSCIGLYRQAEAGILSLDDKVDANMIGKVAGSGVLQYLTTGHLELSLRDIAVHMIVLSDNTAANILIDRLGMSRINKTLDELGFKETRLNRKMMESDAWNENRENLSTPRETARLLELLFNNHMLSEHASSDILNILSIPKPGQIRSRIPETIRVAHKTGIPGGVINDAGIIYLEKRPFLFVCMTSWLSDSKHTEEIIAEIAETAYNYFKMLGGSNCYGHIVQ